MVVAASVEAVQSAVAQDWGGFTASQRRRVIEAAPAAAAKPPPLSSTHPRHRTLVPSTPPAVVSHP